MCGSTASLISISYNSISTINANCFANMIKKNKDNLQRASIIITGFVISLTFIVQCVVICDVFQKNRYYVYSSILMGFIVFANLMSSAIKLIKKADCARNLWTLILDVGFFVGFYNLLCFIAVAMQNDKATNTNGLLWLHCFSNFFCTIIHALLVGLTTYFEMKEKRENNLANIGQSTNTTLSNDD